MGSIGAAEVFVLVVPVAVVVGLVFLLLRRRKG